MPSGKLPTPQDAATVRRILLGRLGRDTEVLEPVRQACQELPQRDGPRPDELR
jgi:hypothetical protein